MPKRFRYTALGVDGRKISGELTAASAEEATGLLQEAGVYVTSVTLLKWRRFFWFLKPGPVVVPEGERIFFLECWAMLLEAGISMQSALLRLRMSSRLSSLARVIDRIQRAIDEGITLTEALKNSRLFPPSWMAVLKVGEERGDFVHALQTLHRYASDARGVKRELLSMLIMPSILLAVVVVWVALFTVKVLPSIGILMAQTGHPAPDLLATQGTHLLVAGTLWTVLVLGILFLFTQLQNRSDQEMGTFQTWVPPSFPLLGPLVAEMHLNTIATGLQLQMEAGIPLVGAMENLSVGISHPTIRRELLQAYQKLREGIPVPEALAQLQVIPPSGLALLAAGDASGKLPDMLGVLAREAREDLKERVKRLMVILRTTVVIATGLLVGILVVLFFGMLYSGITSLPQEVFRANPVVN